MGETGWVRVCAMSGTGEGARGSRCVGGIRYVWERKMAECVCILATLSGKPCSLHVIILVKRPLLGCSQLLG